ncbi:hypothetical protein KP509_39G014500 [Ceratopteris richardii]|uniref:Uncharacterized protein n=1 Tax=Ceratopteris richardii TaxID=49495 RepID=A0A8T2PYX4_CERRI|nr:hypothetical protein KP509_39G014500 [Ceratopteris richardii]
MDDPDQLYDDLFEDLEDGRAIIKTSLHELEDRIKDLSNEAEELKAQVRNLQQENEGLSKQNEILTRNISCLFKTAQMEISRKDKQIKALQQESLCASTSGARSVPLAIARADSLPAKEQTVATVFPALSNGGRRQDEAGISSKKDSSTENEASRDFVTVQKQSVEGRVRHENRLDMSKRNEDRRLGRQHRDRTDAVRVNDAYDKYEKYQDDTRKREREDKHREEHEKRRHREEHERRRHDEGYHGRSTTDAGGRRPSSHAARGHWKVHERTEFAVS